MILVMRTDKPEAEVYLLDNDNIQDSSIWYAHRELSNTLLIKINQLLTRQGLQKGDIRGIVIYKGPGSFTGLRIGISVANTMAYALNVPVVGATGKEWLQTGLKNLGNQSIGSFVMPEYDREAHITQPKK